MHKTSRPTPIVKASICPYACLEFRSFDSKDAANATLYVIQFLLQLSQFSNEVRKPFVGLPKLYTMASIKDFSKRIDELLAIGEKTIATAESTYPRSVNAELFYEFRTSSLSFIQNLYGIHHVYYVDFNRKIFHANYDHATKGRGILTGIRSEISGGWKITQKGLVSAEIFSDFLEMAEHLLNEGYKDAAAVTIGSVLEEHLRQLCTKHEVSLLQEDTKTGKMYTKKMQILNQELVKKSVYNELMKKSVDVWLDIRNNAAHGKYNEYTSEQVIQMLQSVTNFMSQCAV